LAGRSPVFRGLLLILLAIGAYWDSIDNGFAYDDGAVVERNPVVQGREPLDRVFVRDYWGHAAERQVGAYRPVALFTLALDGRAGGGAALPFHVTNLVLHALVVVAAYALFRRRAGEVSAFSAAALFAVLAGPSEAVFAIVGRADLLAALFLVLGLAAHSAPGGLATAAAVMCFALCLGSKESGLVAPAVWLAMDAIVPVASGRSRTRFDTALRLTLYAAVVGVYLVGRTVALGSAFATRIEPLRNPLVTADATARLMGAGRIFFEHILFGLANPLARAYDCSAPACGPAGLGDPLAWSGLAIFACMVALAFWGARRAPTLAAGLAWFTLAFLPASNFAIVGPTAYAERLLYAPALGLCLAVGFGFAFLSKRVPRPWIAWSLFAALALGNAAAVRARSADWESSLTLFLADVELMPRGAVVQNNAAWAATQTGDWAVAEEHARNAVALAPEFVDAHATLALLLARSGRESAALTELEVASAYEPTVAFFLARARILIGMVDLPGAQRAVEAGLGLDPDHPVLLEMKSQLGPPAR